MTCILLSRDIGGIPIDVVVSEKHESEMEIATHPVERSAEIADHAWRKPRKVTIEGVVGQGAAFGAYQAMLSLQDKPQLFTLVTGLKVYPDMLLQSLNAERSSEYARVLKFEAGCQEIIRVSTQTTTGQGGANATTERANGTVNRGEVQARTVPATGGGLTGPKSESILAKYTAG